jgi:hypothetical protein
MFLSYQSIKCFAVLCVIVLKKSEPHCVRIIWFTLQYSKESFTLFWKSDKKKLLVCVYMCMCVVKNCERGSQSRTNESLTHFFEISVRNTTQRKAQHNQRRIMCFWVHYKNGRHFKKRTRSVFNCQRVCLLWMGFFLSQSSFLNLLFMLNMLLINWNLFKVYRKNISWSAKQLSTLGKDPP